MKAHICDECEKVIELEPITVQYWRLSLEEDDEDVDEDEPPFDWSNEERHLCSWSCLCAWAVSQAVQEEESKGDNPV